MIVLFFTDKVYFGHVPLSFNITYLLLYDNCMEVYTLICARDLFNINLLYLSLLIVTY